MVVRVQSADSLDDIARTLAENQVIADAQTFVDLTKGDAELAALQPGYYKVRQHASSAAAADALVDKGNRVGRVDLIPGHQLADVTAKEHHRGRRPPFPATSARSPRLPACR